MCFLPVSFLGKSFWERDSATLLKTNFFKDIFQGFWLKIPLATFRTVAYKNIFFFPRHLCGCFQTLFSSTRLLFLLFLISPVYCFFVFSPIIKFNFHNSWYEHHKEGLGIYGTKTDILQKGSFVLSQINQTEIPHTHIRTEITSA